MKFHNHKKLHTGIAVPVSALTGSTSCGCGEFSDLTRLAKWCSETGLDIIQILPINDTGVNPSPYSAISAMALNPVYINLELIEGYESASELINAFRIHHRSFDHFRYTETYKFKLDILKQIYEIKEPLIINDPGLHSWIRQNEWIKPYAAFKILSEENGTIVWSQWHNDPVFNEDEQTRITQLSNFLDKNQSGYFLQAWIQFELEKQLKEAAENLDKLGINLKGDLPILMDRESCDVWYDRNNFNLKYRAGAPPDDFSENGQNWGFPVFNREAMFKDNFLWWKKRIARFNHFFHAIRLDHVIGFMRIWQIPEGEIHARLGYFSPATYIDYDKLMEAGITDEELGDFARPIVDDEFLKKCADESSVHSIKNKYLNIRNSYYELPESLASENIIRALNEPEYIKDILFKIHNSRVLVKIPSENKSIDKYEDGNYKSDCFAPSWSYQSSIVYQKQTDEKKNILKKLFENYICTSEEMWYEQGKIFLSEICSASDGLFCGEDLGAVPSITEMLLKELNIMSLKVLRWTRKYTEPAAPFILPDTYPYLSVATTSVHDSENLRQWWGNDSNARDHLFPIFNPEINAEEANETSVSAKTTNIPNELNSETAFILLSWFMQTSSEIVIVPIQDFFAIDDRYRISNPAAERINIPGRVLDTNWTYKLPCTLESLVTDNNFSGKIKALTNTRNIKSNSL